MNEQTTSTIYEPPALVEVGKFSGDTLGDGEDINDSVEDYDF